MEKHRFYHLFFRSIYGSAFLTVLLLVGCQDQVLPPKVEIKFSQKVDQLSESEWIATGQYLFETKSLSPKRISCQSCHNPENYFQDGYEVAIVHNKKLIRNTPSLLNLNRHTSFFWDGRANTIREQLEGPLFSRAEMHSDPTFIHQALLTEPTLHQKAMRLDIADKEQAVEFVMYALEKYVLSITTKSTRFHDALAGLQSLTSQEQSGMEIFMDKAQCGRCHPPPHFTDNKFHDIGLVRRKTIFESYVDDGKDQFRLGPDYGRGNIVAGIENLFTFRTPSLINVEHTAPYMHDGAFNELEEIIDFYARKDSVLRKHPLTHHEKQDLLAFLKTLNATNYPY